MQTAILLRRKEEDEQFKCVVKINAEVDMKSTLSKVFGGKGRDPKDGKSIFPEAFFPTSDSLRVICSRNNASRVNNPSFNLIREY